MFRPKRNDERREAEPLSRDASPVEYRITLSTGCPPPSREITVAAAIRQGAKRLGAAGVPSPDFDARLLLRTATSWSPAQLIARTGNSLAPEARRAFDRLIDERAARRPLQHLAGQVEFFGLTLAAGPGALIPRPDTETLVEAALGRLPGASRMPLRIADVGCGSGAVALALARHLPDARIVALDNAPAALLLAAENARRCGLSDRVSLVAGDLLTAGGPATLDGVVANLPYIPDAEIDRLEPEVRDYEPRDALAGGPDGLDPLRRLAPLAARALRPGGGLLVEIGLGQLDAASTVLRSVGFTCLENHLDLAGIPRVLSGSLPAAG